MSLSPTLKASLAAGMIGGLALLTGCASPQQPGGKVVRHSMADASLPIAAAVEVPSDAKLVYLSGKVPPVLDASRPLTDPAAYGGSTEAQTLAVLKSIQDQLIGMNLNLSDVVKMQVYLVGDSRLGGKMDFAGFMRGYSHYFGTTAQPNLPARSTFQVAALANPAWLVEIEVVAVRSAKTAP